MLVGRRWLGLLVLAPLVLSGCGKDSSSKPTEEAAGTLASDEALAALREKLTGA